MTIDAGADIQELTSDELIAKADSAYTPFPAFADWSAVPVATGQWDHGIAEVKQRSHGDEALLTRAREVAKRAAAVETGAIEGLYDLHDGVTITIATQAAYWEAAFAQQAERTRSLIESQLQAYDRVLDFATGNAPIIPAWIRELHASLCAGQKTYPVATATGPQEQTLPLGTYKANPNHVALEGGKLHSYAPVHSVETEIRRFCDQLATPQFANAHPLLQSAYAHHVLTSIHPFADGNGRVARALASVFTYRGGSVPVLVLADNKRPYLAAVRAADTGDVDALVRFFANCTRQAFSLVIESLEAAQVPSVEDGVTQIKRLQVTRGGFAHADVDVAGVALLILLHQRFLPVADKVSTAGAISTQVGRRQQEFPPPPDGYRVPVGITPEVLQLRISSVSPADGDVRIDFCYYLPVDCGADDHIIVQCLSNDSRLQARMDELTPKPTMALQIRTNMFADRTVGLALAQAKELGIASLKRAGLGTGGS